MAEKVPIRAVYNGADTCGLSELQDGEVVGVEHGGLGACTLTTNGVLLGNTQGAVQVSSALTTNGQLLIGGTSGPAVANITGTANEVEITSGDGSITIGLPATVSGLTNVSATNLTGTLATAAQANITSVGTLTSLNSSGNVSFDGGTFIFNESGADKDFRIEGDSEANLFIADASVDRIGIGTATPSHLVDIEGVGHAATCFVSADLCATTKVVAAAICMGGGYALPTSDGTAGYILCTDGSGAVSFAEAAGGGHTIAEDGSTFTSRTCLNFCGSAVTVTDCSATDSTDVKVDATGACMPIRVSAGTQCYACLATATIAAPCLQCDSAPKLGGSLDVNGNSIISASNGNIPITPNGSGIVIIDGICHPIADGSAGQLLCTDGSAALKFATITATSPAGSDTYVQFNDGGAFGGAAGLTWDDTTFKASNICTAGTATIATVTATSIGGTLTTAAQANITSVGTLSSLDVSGDLTVGTVTADGDTSSGDAATMGYTATEGIIITGQGSTNDVTIKNDADGTVISIPTGGTATCFAGAIVASGTITGTLATAAQASVTSLGTLTALTVSGDVSFDGGTFVFNESGADKDFRIEGDSDANLFIADASTDRIGIGTASPSHLLDVEGVVNVATCIVTPKLCVPTTGFGCNGYVLPTGDGQADGVMCTDGSGGLSFASPPYKTSTTYTADQTFQDNIKLTLGTGGDADLYYDGTNVILLPAVVGSGKVGIGTATPSHFVDIEGVAHAATCFVSADLCATTKVVSAALCVGSQYALPAADGSAGQLMCTDGSGAIAFATASGVTLAGSTNNTIATVTGSDALAGEANLRFDGTSLEIGPAATVSSSSNIFVVNGDTCVNSGMTIYSSGTSSGQMKLAFGNAEGADAGAALIYSNSADTLIFNVNGANERMRISSAGLVGIGTAAPATLLHAEGSTGYMKFDPAAGNTCLALTSSSGVTNFGTFNGSHLNFYTDSTERMRIDTSGRVGIGTSTMAQKLDVRQDSGGLPVVTICNAATCGRGFYINAGCGNPSHYIMSVQNNPGTAKLVFTGDGLLGVGTSAPAAGIHIEHTTNASLIVGYSSSYYTCFGYNGTIDIIDGTDTNCFQVKFDQSAKFTVNPVGNTNIIGSLSKSSGSFNIEHPLESKKETHRLVHSFIEGPQADLLYRGTATLSSGTATINIDTAARITDGTFGALVNNVQAFTTNETGFDGVRASVSGNILTIESEDDTSTATISWLVVGERKDAHMLDTDWTDSDGRVITEPEKTEEG